MLCYQSKRSQFSFLALPMALLFKAQLVLEVCSRCEHLQDLARTIDPRRRVLQ